MGPQALVDQIRRLVPKRPRRSRIVGVAHHVTDIMGNKISLLDFEFVKDTHDIAARCFLVIAFFGVRREAHPLQIRSDDRVVVEGTPVTESRNPSKNSA